MVVSVEDNGIGIPAGEVRRIFEPFYRVNGAAAETSGAGLGLAIVHHAVKAHGGKITVDTEGGRGQPLLDLPARRAPTREAGG